MTPQQALALLPILKAYAGGKTVQCRWKLDDTWWDASQEAIRVHLTSDAVEWRIKPEPPKPREWVVCPHHSTLSGPAHYMCDCTGKVRVREVVG